MLMKSMKAAYPTVMSKMFEPTELDTAMSPSPFLATMTLVMRSGMEVPAASMVNPMISSVIPIVSPTWKQTPARINLRIPKYSARILFFREATIVTDDHQVIMIR